MTCSWCRVRTAAKGGMCRRCVSAKRPAVDPGPVGPDHIDYHHHPLKEGLHAEVPTRPAAA